MPRRLRALIALIGLLGLPACTGFASSQIVSMDAPPGHYEGVDYRDIGR